VASGVGIVFGEARRLQEEKDIKKKSMCGGDFQGFLGRGREKRERSRPQEIYAGKGGSNKGRVRSR